MQWLPGGHWLLIQVYPFPWGIGILQPTGDLYILNAEQGTNRLVLKGGSFERFSVSPDGGQIAALDTAAFDENGKEGWNKLQDGTLFLIDVSTSKVTQSLPVRLPADPWAMVAPAYSPDGKKLV
jgi:streptogramin lyase